MMYDAWISKSNSNNNNNKQSNHTVADIHEEVGDRIQSGKEKQKTRYWVDGVIDFIVETQTKKLEPERVTKNVETAFANQVWDNNREEEYVALQQRQWGGNCS